MNMKVMSDIVHKYSLFKKCKCGQDITMPIQEAISILYIMKFLKQNKITINCNNCHKSHVNTIDNFQKIIDDGIIFAHKQIMKIDTRSVQELR